MAIGIGKPGGNFGGSSGKKRAGRKPAKAAAKPKAAKARASRKKRN